MKKFLILFLLSFKISLIQSQDMPNKNLRVEYLSALEKLHWKSDFKKNESLIKPSIYINQKASLDDLPLGMSKFGGTPDLPIGTEWPTFQGRPMIFLAQINFEETKSYDLENQLPDHGVIYFFIYFDDPVNEFGTEYEFIFQKEKYEVIFSTSDKLKSFDFPKELAPEYKFKPTQIEFKSFYTIPSRDALEIGALAAEDKETADAFNDTFGNYEGKQLLGYTMPIQFDVTWDWAYSYLEFKSYELTDSDKANIDSIRPEFVTLLQFSLANSNTGFEKIGSSMGYFGITKIDLKKKDFKKAILIFQDS